MHLESREHFALFLPVDETMVVLHGDERCEAVGDRVVCKSHDERLPLPRGKRQDVLCMTWTGEIGVSVYLSNFAEIDSHSQA